MVKFGSVFFELRHIATYFVVYKLYCIISLVKLSYKPLQGLRDRRAEPHRKKGFFIIAPGMPNAATSIAPHRKSWMPSCITLNRPHRGICLKEP